MSDRRQDRLLRVVLVLAAITTIISLGLAIIGLPTLYTSAANTAAVKNGTDLQGCRARYAARVTEANSAVTLLVLEGLVAVAQGDDGALDGLIARADDAHTAVDRATDAYRAAIARSIDDPEGFLASCD